MGHLPRPGHLYGSFSKGSDHRVCVGTAPGPETPSWASRQNSLPARERQNGGEGEQPLFPVWHSVASFSSPGSRHLEDLERNHPLLSSCDSLPLTAQPGQQAGDQGQGSSLTPPGPWTPGAHTSLEKTESSACPPAPSPSSSVLLFSVSHHSVSH